MHMSKPFQYHRCEEFGSTLWPGERAKRDSSVSEANVDEEKRVRVRKEGSVRCGTLSVLRCTIVLQAAINVTTLNQVQQLSALNKLDQHVNTGLILECIDQFTNKRMVKLDHHRPLALSPSGLSLV